ncbi:MAG: phosphate acyltransferase PlsX [Eubacteriales bacterium]|nr:phosphate acyltransferase PlsX [Eubacteriales bacterium]
MKIIIDAMSGDNAPEAIVSGCVMAAREFGQEYILVGKEPVIRDLLAKEQAEGLPISIRHADDVIDMHDDPATAVRRKKEASMSVALRMLKDGEGDALISAGNTGALLSGATLVTKRIRGIRRAALPTQLPCRGGHVLLLDSGANAECTPEYLMQFAYMGSFYAEKVMGIQKPRVGLVNNGAEDTKGDTLRKETYAMLQAAGDAGRINFIGNVEGSDVPKGACDVAVTDGFTGNVMLKTVEGVAGFLMGELKNMFLTNTRTKLSYLLLKPAMGGLKKMLSSSEVGGAPFLGISKPVFKAHGSSDARAIRSAVKQAMAYVDADLTGEIERNMDYMTL